MSKSTTLASGPINATDTLIVDLVEPDDMPPSMFVRWPGLGTPTDAAPTRFPAVALAVIAVMGSRVLAAGHRP